MGKDSKGKGKKRKNSRQSSQKGGLPKKTKPAADSLSIPPASTQRLSGQDGQPSSATGDTPKQGCRQTGRKRSRADKEDRRLPKKTETEESSRHTDICPDSAVPSTSQTSVDFCSQDTSSSGDPLSESMETEGQSDSEVMEQEPAQQPARMEMNNREGAKGNIQAVNVKIFKGNDRLKAIGARTTANLERACPQGYVRTRSYYRALNVVTKQGTCILTGSSGSGKTTLARHLLLHFRDQGFLPLEMITPDECQCVPWHKVGDKKYKLVLLVDNVLGGGNYEDELRRKWGAQLEPMRPYIDRGHVKIILASRANIYAQIRDVKGSRELLQEAPEVSIDGGDCWLTDKDKTEILRRVLTFHKVKLSVKINMWALIRATDTTAKLGFPQMCIYLATNKKALGDPVKFVQNPLQFLDEEFSQLQLNDLMSYYVLVLVLLKEGNLAESFLKDANNKRFMSQVAEMVGLSVAPGFGQIQKLAKHLCESYLEYNSKSKCFSFSHESIWDCLFIHLCQSNFDMAVEVCTWKQLLLYVRTDSRCEDKEDFVYLAPEADWPILAKRLLQELTCGDADLACSHPCLQHPDFVTWLKEEFLSSESIGILLRGMHEKRDVVNEYLKCGNRDCIFENSVSSYKVNIFSYQSLVSSLLLGRCSSLAKHILESAQFHTLSPVTQSQILTEALACALYVSDCGLADWLLHRGARVTEEGVRAACCAEQEHIGLVKRALHWEEILSAGMLTEMARMASQMDRSRTLELVLSQLPRCESSQAELDRILAELICITHPIDKHARKLPQLAYMVGTLKKAGAQFRSHIDQFYAAGHFDPSALGEWLEQKVDLSATDEDGCTLLHHAAAHGALSNVQALLGCIDSLSQHDLLVNARNRYGDTALHLAARGGHLAVVDFLLKNGGDAHLTNENDETALWMLASCEEWNVEDCTFSPSVKGVPSSFSNGQQKEKSDSTVKEMLRMLAVNTHGLIYRDSALFQASQNGHTVLVEVLVENKADVNSRGYGVRTPVHVAAEEGHVGVLEVLCANGAQLDARDWQGQSALHLAAEQGHLSVVEMLIENKVNVDAQDAYMRTPLHLASEEGHVEIVKRLLDKKASVNVTDIHGQQPLHLAAGKGHFAVVECLLEREACANAQDSRGTTPLHLASCEGHTSIAELLLTYKASVNAQNDRGETALHLAMENGKWDEAKFLMHIGADMAITTKNGDTVLHSMAAWNSEIHVYRLSYRSARSPDFSLVESLGSLTKCKNNEGNDPIMLAVEGKNWEALLQMLKLQCDLSVTDREGNTALHLAVMLTEGVCDYNSYRFTLLNEETGSKTRNQCVSVMVEKCVKHLNVQNRVGDTPLLLAARAGDVFAMAELLKHHLKLDLTVRGKGGNTILHEVAWNISDECCTAADESVKQKLQSLVSRCAELVNCPNDDGDTPILIAARKGSWFLLSLLLKHPLDLSVTAKGGSNILHELVSFLCVENSDSVKQILELLVQRGADLINCPNDCGDTLILIAAREGRWFLLSLLLKQKCDVRTCDKRGNTLLHCLAKYTPSEKLETTARAVIGDLAEIVDGANEDGDTAVMLAAGSGNVWMVRELLKLQCNVRLTNKRGETALYLAAKNGHFSVMEMLGEDVDVSIQTKEGNTVLHALAACRGLSCEYRNNEAVREVVRSVVEKGRSVVNCPNSSGETPLSIAFDNNNFLVLEVLVGEDVDVSIQIKEGNTVLHALAACGGLKYEDRDSEVVRSLVEKYRHVVNHPNSNGETPLYIAIKNSNFLLVEMLLGQGVDVSIQTQEGNTVLHALAACRGLEFNYKYNEVWRERMKSLVEKGRSVVNCPNSSGKTPLHTGFENSNFLVMQMLMGENADVSIQTNEGNNVLHALAACQGLEDECRDNGAGREKVRSLVAKGRSVVSCPNSHGKTPLYIAIENCNFLLMEMLLGQNADVSIQTKEGNNVLHALAACEGLEYQYRDNEAVREVVRQLVEKCRSVVNCLNSSGETPLYIAFEHRNFLLMEMLLSRDADVSIQTKEGNTVLHALAALQHTDLSCKPRGNEVRRELVRLLVEKGRSVVNRPNSSGETPLYIAFDNSNFIVMEVLLAEDVDVSIQTEEGNTVLHALAACEGLEEEHRCKKVVRELVRSVVEKGRSVVNSPNSNGETPLYIAFDYSNFIMIEMLLAEDVDVSIQTKEGNTVLHALAACQPLEDEYRGNEAVREKVRSVVEKGRSVVNCPNSSGETPLYIAFDNNNFLVMEMLLDQDVDVSIQTKEGNTVLHALAAFRDLEYKYRDNEGMREKMRSLVERGSIVANCPNSSRETPLYLSFLHGNLCVAEWLLEQVGSFADSREGGLTDKPLETTGCSLPCGANTPLHGLAASSDLQKKWKRDEALGEKVAVWVKRFSNWVNHQDPKGDTPILIALREGNLFVVEQLLQCGADLSVTDAGGGTVLHALALSATPFTGTLDEIFMQSVLLERCLGHIFTRREPELTEANNAMAVRVTELAQSAGVTPLTPNKKGKTALDLLKQTASHKVLLPSFMRPYTTLNFPTSTAGTFSSFVRMLSEQNYS